MKLVLPLMVFLTASVLTYSATLSAEVTTKSLNLPSSPSSTDINTASSTSPLINDSITKLTKLNQQEKYKQAYELALSLRTKWEGDDNYDVQFAIAAARTSNINEAIFTLLRLLNEQPSNYLLRIELARCYFALNQLPLAKAAFITALYQLNNSSAKAQQNESEITAQQQAIQVYLKRIAYQQSRNQSAWENKLKVGLGYDSNLNSAANIDSIDATFFYNDEPALTGNLELNSKQQPLKSGYTKLQASSYYQKPINKHNLIDASAAVTHKDNTQEDLTHLSIKAGYTIKHSQHTMRIGAITRQYGLAGDHLLNQLLSQITWQWGFSESWQSLTAFEIGQQSNPNNSSLTFNTWQGKISIRHTYKNLSQTLQVTSGQDRASKAEYDFQGRHHYSLGYQLQSPIGLRQHLYMSINYRLSNYADAYANDHVFFANKTRQDNERQFMAGYNYRINNRTSVNLSASHINNHSNLTLFDYQRTLLETALTVAF